MNACRECGAALREGETCTDLFNRLLAFEAGVPGAPGEAPHLHAVGAYQLQHPDRLEPAALLGLYEGIANQLSGTITLAEHRRRVRRASEGAVRVVRRAPPGPDNPPVSPWPKAWPMTIADATDIAVDTYIATVRRWAETTVAAIGEARGKRGST